MHPGFVPRNHPNQAKRRGVDDSIDDRETPPCGFVPLHAEFDFTLDAAASHDNTKLPRYCTPDGFFLKDAAGSKAQLGTVDGLAIGWGGERVWCNPPFSGLRPWIEKAWDERQAELVCILLPNNRAEQPFYQELIEPYRDRAGSILTTRNLPKRRPFLYKGATIGNRTSKNPPFGITLCIWDRRDPRRRYNLR